MHHLSLPCVMMSLVLLVAVELLGLVLGRARAAVLLRRGWRAFYTLVFCWCLLTDDEAVAAPPVPDES